MEYHFSEEHLTRIFLRKVSSLNANPNWRVRYYRLRDLNIGSLRPRSGCAVYRWSNRSHQLSTLLPLVVMRSDRERFAPFSARASAVLLVQGQRVRKLLAAAS